MKKILKGLGLVSLISSTILMSGCSPQERALVGGLAVGTVVAASVLSSAPRNRSTPYYYNDGRYYTGGYYRSGYYYHNGHRYSNGRYYRGNRYSNGRRYENRRVRDRRYR